MKTNLVQISIMLMLAGCSFSCVQKNENDKGILKIGAITEIKLEEIGEYAQYGSRYYGPSLATENAQYGLSLRIENLYDSRCAIGVECCWAGEVSVQLNLTTNQDEYDFTFNASGYGGGSEGIVIEGTKYRLMGVLPYPVWGEEQPVKTVRILVSAQSPVSDSQWKFIQYLNNKTSEIRTNPQNIEPYIIHFKNDFTVEFPIHCRAPQGTYIAGNDGSIAFDINYGDVNCQNPIYDWEIFMINNLINTKKYTIKENQLTISFEEHELYFERIIK